MLVVPVSQNAFALVSRGIAQLSRGTLQYGVLRTCACVKLSTKRISQHFGVVLTSLKKYCATWGVAAIVLQYHAIWGH